MARAGAIGHLVGEEGKGLAAMFHMMNEARVSVGAGAMALGYTGYLHALQYAEERTQGRPLADKDPSSPPVRLVDHPDVRRMLLAQKSYVEGALALVLYCGRLVDEVATADSAEERAEADVLLGMLTPIAKSWPSQWCLAANDLAIQVHGGYGYTRDYAVEQFYRDNRLNPIHEGTHGIQALDLLGRKVVMDGGRGLGLLADRIRATTARAAETGGDAAAYAAELDARLDDLLRVTGALWQDGDPDLALANASVYLEAAGHLVVAWLWLEQLLAVGDSAGDFYDGKRAAARYFFRFELPSIGPKLDPAGVARPDHPGPGPRRPVSVLLDRGAPAHRPALGLRRRAGGRLAQPARAVRRGGADRRPAEGRPRGERRRGRRAHQPAGALLRPVRPVALLVIRRTGAEIAVVGVPGHRDRRVRRTRLGVVRRSRGRHPAHRPRPHRRQRRRTRADPA